MLFERRFHEGLRRGTTRLTFRAWSRPQVREGGRYRCHGVGMLEVVSLRQIPLSGIDDDEARAAGFEDAAEGVAYLRKKSKATLRATSRVYRVELCYAGPPTASDMPPVDATLSDADVAELSARLEKMDRLSRHGPWTAATLALIAEHPEVAASKLAPRLGRETQPFKADVRKLKKLGLTTSFDVGYRLSERGRAYLARG